MSGTGEKTETLWWRLAVSPGWIPQSRTWGQFGFFGGGGRGFRVKAFGVWGLGFRVQGLGSEGTRV